jgi:transcriptional regulator with XRE-family HTH domain
MIVAEQMTLSGAQCRMARAYLKWGVRELAEKAGVNANTITRFEGGGGALAATADKLQAVFEAQGLEFTADGGVTPPKRRDR